MSSSSDVNYQQLRGINLQSGCLSYLSLPAVSGSNYLFPDSADVGYMTSKGANFCRIIFCWEALQPTLGGSISNTYTTNLINTVNLALANNMYVMIEPHPYNSSSEISFTYNNIAIGTSPVTNAQYANLWGQLAAQFTDSRVIFGLCNEPNGISSPTWLSASQAAINAIRSANNDNMIFVQPVNYGSALGFFSSNYYDGSAAPSVEILNLTDPINNLVLSVHLYFDSSDGYSGGATDIVSNTFGSTTLYPIVAWCKTNNWKFHVSEFAVDSSNSSAASAMSDLYTFMASNENVCIGGSWWGYTAVGFGPSLFDLQPSTAYTVDDPDMVLFTPFTGNSYINSANVNLMINKISGNADGYISILEPIELGFESAQSGRIRLPNQGAIVSRNSSNSADLSVAYIDNSNNLELGASSTPIIMPCLAGLGSGYVVISNTGLLSWSAGPSGSFSAGGDLSGTPSSQNVISITGASGMVAVAPAGNIITWNKTTVAPGLTQSANTTNSATAANLTISAQSATGTSSTGGNLILGSGTGTSKTGSIRMVAGNITDTLVAAQGMISTQNKNTMTYNGYCTTINGSTSVIALTIPVPTGKSVSAAIQYIGRNTSTIGTYSGTFLTGAENASGTAALFTGISSRTVSTVYDTAEAAAGVSGNGCTSAVSGANLLIQIAGCSGMTIDWTFQANIIVS